MASDPVQYLVVPRFLACLLMTPLLTAMGDLIGLVGGWGLITYVMDASIPGFFDRVFEFLDAGDFWVGIIKSVFFGGIIASVGCFYGLNTSGGAEGVGKATTSAVVIASLGILIADFFLSKMLF